MTTQLMSGISQRRTSLSRRQLLELGCVSTLNLSLPELLRASAAQTTRAPHAGADRSCISIVLHGGPSQLDTFDLKPAAPDNIRGPYKPIATTVPGAQICELLPRLARLADRYCLLRSMFNRSNLHDPAMNAYLTGQQGKDPQSPCLGSIVSKLRPSSGGLPSYVWLMDMHANEGELVYQHGGFLGAAHAPVRVGDRLNNPAAAEFRVPVFDPPAGMPAARLHDRRQLLAALEPPGHPLLQSSPGRSMQHFQERAFDLIGSPEAKRAFDLNKEPAAVRDRYGRHPLGQNLLLARRLIEAGVRLVSVAAWTGKAADEKLDPISIMCWDMHGDTGKGSIFGTGNFGLGRALPCLDQALSALLEDLEQRGLLNKTLVATAGEFGRSPKISAAPSPGREHYPDCYSALLAGAGIRGGMVYGASDKIAAYVKDKPVSPEDFGATLLHALGVSPETRLGADGFTRPASNGQPILDLFA